MEVMEPIYEDAAEGALRAVQKVSDRLARLEEELQSMPRERIERNQADIATVEDRMERVSKAVRAHNQNLRSLNQLTSDRGDRLNAHASRLDTHQALLGKHLAQLKENKANIAALHEISSERGERVDAHASRLDVHQELLGRHLTQLRDNKTNIAALLLDNQRNMEQLEQLEDRIRAIKTGGGDSRPTSTSNVSVRSA